MSSVASAAKILDTSLSHREDGMRRRVLYAEDQASARIVTTALLERMGFEVVAVEDGELAVAAARQGAYDIILLDIEMPVMDGVTAARFIRADAELCRGAPILALSAFLADSTEHSVWRDAFDSALPKPANSNELQRAMKAAMGKQNAKPVNPFKPTVGWVDFGRNLPRGTVSMLVKVAHEEMLHLILALASCLEAGDLENAERCLQGLKSVAASFDVSELSTLIANADMKAKTIDLALLHAAIVQWQERQTALQK